MTIEPNQTLNLDVKELVAKASSSSQGSISALTGEISWFTPDQSDVFGRVLIAREGSGGSTL